VRAATANRKTPWTVAELEPTLPRRIEGQQTWKASASHNAETAAIGLSTRGWNTGAPQAPGMWFQIELPQPAMLTEVEFDSPGPPAGRGGGAGGRGAGGGAPAAPPVVPYPRGYRVEVSQDGANWGKAVAEGKGSGAHTSITFAPVRAKFVRVTQTDAVENAPNWAIANVRLYEAGARK
jgi:hypothetical protein